MWNRLAFDLVAGTPGHRAAILRSLKFYKTGTLTIPIATVRCSSDPRPRRTARGSGARWVNDRCSQHALREANAVSRPLATRADAASRRALGRGAERDSVYSRLFDATPPTVRDCVNDFDTAKLRRGVPGVPATGSNPSRLKLLQPIQSVLSLGPRVNTRRGPHW